MVPAPWLGQATSLAHWVSRLTLARWLGPWASPEHHPTEVRRRSLTVPALRSEDRPFEAWLYLPRAGAPVVGSYLIAPGLHHAGPADPRLDRFARILAAAGMMVLAPFLPDYIASRVDPRVDGDLDRAFGVLLGRSELPSGSRPGVFSVSFGSLPALRLAASANRAEQIGGLVVFGGYADWEATIRFALTGEVDGVVGAPRDPLNQPVVFINLIDDIPGAPEDPTPLLVAWRKYMAATWGRPEMKVSRRFAAVAREIAQQVPAELRKLFLVGCGVEAGGVELCTAALAASAVTEVLDPRPVLGGLRCSVYLVHGVDDDVIHHTQMDALAAAMPARVPVVTYRTGLYGHSGVTDLFASLLRRVPDAAREILTMLNILNAMVAAGTSR